jgi:hypothetical protein
MTHFLPLGARAKECLRDKLMDAAELAFPVIVG